MTNLETLEKVRAKVIEAVPDIMRLGFGCRVERYAGITDTVVRIGTGDHYPFRVMIYRPERDGHVTIFDYECNKDEVEAWKVIGRPITLADVLRAIEKEKRGGRLKSPNLKRLSEFSDVLTLIDLWNLALSLNDQEPEVIEFIGKVLGV